MSTISGRGAGLTSQLSDASVALLLFPSPLLQQEVVVVVAEEFLDRQGARKKSAARTWVDFGYVHRNKVDLERYDIRMIRESYLPRQSGAAE